MRLPEVHFEFEYHLKLGRRAAVYLVRFYVSYHIFYYLSSIIFVLIFFVKEYVNVFVSFKFGSSSESLVKK